MSRQRDRWERGKWIGKNKQETYNIKGDFPNRCMYSLGMISIQVRGKTVETDEVTGEKIQEKSLSYKEHE